VVSLEIRHDHVHIQTDDSDATLYALFDAGYRPTEIEVGSLGLEQAFLAITKEDDQANGAEPTPEPAPAAAAPAQSWPSSHHTL
jgi:ABC-2 type transport system ATP-binding protein